MLLLSACDDSVHYTSHCRFTTKRGVASTWWGISHERLWRRWPLISKNSWPRNEKHLMWVTLIVTLFELFKMWWKTWRQYAYRLIFCILYIYMCMHTHTHDMYICIYIHPYIYLSLLMWVCVCLQRLASEAERLQREHLWQDGIKVKFQYGDILWLLISY